MAVEVTDLEDGIGCGEEVSGDLAPHEVIVVRCPRDGGSDKFMRRISRYTNSRYRPMTPHTQSCFSRLRQSRGWPFQRRSEYG